MWTLAALVTGEDQWLRVVKGDRLWQWLLQSFPRRSLAHKMVCTCLQVWRRKNLKKTHVFFIWSHVGNLRYIAWVRLQQAEEQDYQILLTSALWWDCSTVKTWGMSVDVFFGNLRKLLHVEILVPRYFMDFLRFIFLIFCEKNIKDQFIPQNLKNNS